MRKKAAKFALCTLKGCNCITVLWFERRFRRAVYFWMPGWKGLTCCDSKTNLAENKTNTIEPQIHRVTESVLSRTFADMHCQSDVLENTQHLRPARSRQSTCLRVSNIVWKQHCSYVDFVVIYIDQQTKLKIKWWTMPVHSVTFKGYCIAKSKLRVTKLYGITG